MTTTETVNLIGELSVNLKSAVENNETLSIEERKYLDGMIAGLKLASETIKATMKSDDFGDYPDTIPNQFDNMTGSMNL